MRTNKRPTMRVNSIRKEAIKKKVAVYVKSLQEHADIENVVTLTTGIINKNANTEFSHTEVVNRRSSPVQVRVVVFSWNNQNSPVVLSSVAQTIAANSFRSFNTNISAVNFHYEVVILLSSVTNVVANHFGLNSVGGVPTSPQEGDTVLFKELVHIV
ncbi:hypothetical protein [Paenibacillus sp. MBLB4367]|uniref:hypothetical protein n=1 Tax=Paenibacillus sp. MBLB4367 TaxID=3384767 RepID=UPI00390836EC